MRCCFWTARVMHGGSQKAMCLWVDHHGPGCQSPGEILARSAHRSCSLHAGPPTAASQALKARTIQRPGHTFHRASPTASQSVPAMLGISKGAAQTKCQPRVAASGQAARWHQLLRVSGAAAAYREDLRRLQIPCKSQLGGAGGRWAPGMESVLAQGPMG